MTRIAGLLAILLVVAAAVGLYRFKDESRDQARHIDRLRAEISAERDTIAVLRAELNYLDQPARIQQLAERYLDLQRLDVQQISVIETLPMRPIDLGPGVDGPLGGFAGGENRVVQ